MFICWKYKIDMKKMKYIGPINRVRRGLRDSLLSPLWAAEAQVEVEEGTIDLHAYGISCLWFCAIQKWRDKIAKKGKSIQ